MNNWFQHRFRRVILDMHIGDWDSGFLARFDPVAVADACEQARLSSLMLYAISHVGLCYWPTKHGKMHAGLNGRDIVGELVRELKARDIAACGYISVVFDNWAFLNHPDWRQQPADYDPPDGKLYAGSRYGLVCPNNPDYLAYVMAQIDDLYGRYDFDGAFFDMTFWPTVCLCEHCRRRFQDEDGKAIPLTLDWFDEDWCTFQAARERWLGEFCHALTKRSKTARPGISVHHNFAGLPRDWRMSVTSEVAQASDFLGADFYGDPLEQVLATRLFASVSRNGPIEFMTTRCPTPGYHELVKSADHAEMQVLGATLASAAFMWIDAVNLDGTINKAVYRRIGEVFDKTAPYEPFLGGTPVADVAIYCSDAAGVDFRKNGTPAVDIRGCDPLHPHSQAARGWTNVLQKSHVPFDVITPLHLQHLERYQAVILPDLLRMEQREIDAIRAYVAAGGHIYASRYTSLVEADGTRHDDFKLADVFGCHLAADDLGTVTYIKPAAAGLTEAIDPQAYLDHFARPGSEADGAGALRLHADAPGRTLATLTLPYRKEWGDIFDSNWASIHSAPPWEDTDAPAIVLNQFGAGRCIYSAADIECVPSDANEAAMSHLLGLLLSRPLSCTVDAHPCVWTSIFHQPELKRYRICFLNHQQQLPPVPIRDISFTLRPPGGARFTSLVRAPEESPVPFTTDTDGALQAGLQELNVFTMLLATYEQS